MAVTFRLAAHRVKPDIQIVEVLIDGVVGGVIYPAGEREIILASAHVSEKRLEEGFVGEVREDERGLWPPIPAWFVRFDPSPYEIRGGKVVKLSR
ncbi:hypothetical protein HYW67_04305 [Candidatus Parcubacteria bacterium]|nr:hypothetical protein [Candidatus Parcubacteria bacterium]